MGPACHTSLPVSLDVYLDVLFLLSASAGAETQQRHFITGRHASRSQSPGDGHSPRRSYNIHLIAPSQTKTRARGLSQQRAARAEDKADQPPSGTKTKSGHKSNAPNRDGWPRLAVLDRSSVLAGPAWQPSTLSRRFRLHFVLYSLFMRCVYSGRMR